MIHLFDPHIITIAFIGGFVFFHFLHTILCYAGIYLPHIRDMWKVGLVIVIVFFITFYMPTYINRFLEGRDIIHSWNLIISYIFFGVGALVSSIIYSRRKYG